MKNLIFISAFLLTVVFQANAINIPTHSTLNVLTHQKAIILNLSDIEASTIAITDKYGANVFEQEIGQYDNGVKYMMSSFPAGEYTIKIQGKDFVEMYKAIITSDALTIEETETYLRPSLKEVNNKIAVAADLVKEEKIQIAIYNEYGYLVFKFDDSKTGRYNRAFDLNQLEKGKYNVVVSTDHFTESRSISL